MIGKRVLPLRGEGTWQQYVKTSASFAVPVSDWIPDSDACRLYINPLTAWVVCKLLFGNGRPDGYCLLVNACSSAIGRIFAQWAAVFGYRLIAVVRKAEHRQELLRLGAWQVVDSSQTDLREAVLELTHGRGADAAIDSIGGSDGYRLAQAVRRCGLFLSIGLLSGVQVEWQRIATKLGVEGKLFHLRHWIASASDYAWQGAFTQLFALYRQKQLDLGKPAASFTLSEAAQAVRAAERLGGKVLLV
jgi:NADPH2:quinone reductase